MRRPQYYPIGQLKKPFGHHGHLVFDIKEELENVIDDLEHIFINIEGAYIPFFIEKFDVKTDLLVKLEEVDSPEEASKLSGKSFFITQDQVKEDVSKILNKYGDLIGFEIYNDNEPLGKILEVEEYPSQLMIKTNYKGKDILLPLVDHMIIDIDNEARTIKLDLPEGILDLN